MSEAAELSMAEHRDYTGAKIGMWLFLFTELLLFGGLFLIYAVYRSVHPQEFHVAAAELNVLLGSVNTLVLLTSIMIMVLAVHAIQQVNRRMTLLLIGVTIAFVGTCLGEDETHAATRGGMIFGTIVIIAGVALWRLLRIGARAKQA